MQMERLLLTNIKENTLEHVPKTLFLANWVCVEMAFFVHIVKDSNLK